MPGPALLLERPTDRRGSHRPRRRPGGGRTHRLAPRWGPWSECFLDAARHHRIPVSFVGEVPAAPASAGRSASRTPASSRWQPHLRIEVGVGTRGTDGATHYDRWGIKRRSGSPGNGRRHDRGRRRLRRHVPRCGTGGTPTTRRRPAGCRGGLGSLLSLGSAYRRRITTASGRER